MAPGIRRGRPACLRSGRDPCRLPGRRDRTFHRRGPRLRRRAGLRGQQGDRRAAPGGRGARDDRGATSTPTRTAGGPTRRSIYRAMSSWFVQVTAFKDRMVELNQEINWVPEHVRDGAFGKWLEGARDWSITRNRFWGAPIPVWKSDDPRYPRVDVYGSLDELGGRLRRAPGRSAPPRHRRAHPAEPRRPHRRVDDAARARRARLLVRVRLDALRPGPLPLRER